MEMTMTADETKAFMRELYRDYPNHTHEDFHADFIGFIVGETYRKHFTVGAVSYKCIHRTAKYATFEAVDPWTGETVQFRRKLRICGGGCPTAWIGYDEDCKSPFGERIGITEYIRAADIVY